MLATSKTQVTVSADVLEVALCGGERARQLSQKCADRRASAEAALRQTLSEAPDIIVQARAHARHLEEEKVRMCQELESLATTVDGLVAESSAVAERAVLARSKKDALDQLATILHPFLTVANAVQYAEEAETGDVSFLLRSLVSLEQAARMCAEASNHQLRSYLPMLQDRALEVTSMMQFRFLDMISISPNSITVRPNGKASGILYEPRAHQILHDATATPADALAKAGLLGEALREVVAKLRAQKVAEHLRSATAFLVKPPSGNVVDPMVEWNSDGDGSDELLEFDLDDIEEVPESEVDALTSALDISNAASRCLAIFDLLRTHVVGERHSSALATAMQPWIVGDILPSTAVLAVQRAIYSDTGVPADALRSRVLAVNTSARVLQSAMQARGADPTFGIHVDVGEVERSVASECRAQSVLSARRAIGTFANARRDVSQMLSCPLSTSEYLAPSERSVDYFPPCIVSRASTMVLDVFSRCRTDAMHALAGGSLVIGRSLLGAACECVEAYRSAVPVQCADDMRTSLRLKVLYYNDCMMLKHACEQAAVVDQHVPRGESGDGGGRMSADEEEVRRRSSAEFAAVASAIGKSGESVMSSVCLTAEKGLLENLASACRNGGLGAYGTLTRIQRSSALSSAFHVMREVVDVLAELAPTELAESTAASLCEKYLERLCAGVLEPEEILPDACSQMDAILEDADGKVNILMQRVAGMDEVRRRWALTISEAVETPETVSRLARARVRVGAYRNILSSRMEDIVHAYRHGRYGEVVDRQQVESFILKIFEDTPLRASLISELDVNLDTERQEWGSWD